MKYFKRLGKYKASNVSFSPSAKAAYSYGWWQFVKEVNGTLVFNDYNYSPSTCKHQAKVRSLLRELGLEIGLTVETCSDLNGTQRYGQRSENIGLEAAENSFCATLLEQMKNYAVIYPNGNLFGHVELIEKTFKVKLTNKRRAELIVKTEEELCDAFLERSVRRQERNERLERESQERKIRAASHESQQAHMAQVLEFKERT